MDDLAAIDGAIAALEAQRAVLGDAVVDDRPRARCSRNAPRLAEPTRGRAAPARHRPVLRPRRLHRAVPGGSTPRTSAPSSTPTSLRWQRHIEAQRRRRREVHRRRRDGRVRSAPRRRGRPAPGDPRGAADARPPSTSSTPSIAAELRRRARTMRVGIDTGEVVVEHARRPTRAGLRRRRRRRQPRQPAPVRRPAGRRPDLGRHVSPRPGLVRRAAADRAAAEGHRRSRSTATSSLSERPRGFRLDDSRGVEGVDDRAPSDGTIELRHLQDRFSDVAEDGRWQVVDRRRRRRRRQVPPAVRLRPLARRASPSRCGGSAAGRAQSGRAAPYALPPRPLRHPLRHPRQRRRRRGPAEVGARRRAGARAEPATTANGATSSASGSASTSATTRHRRPRASTRRALSERATSAPRRVLPPPGRPGARSSSCSRTCTGPTRRSLR